MQYCIHFVCRNKLAFKGHAVVTTITQISEKLISNSAPRQILFVDDINHLRISRQLKMIHENMTQCMEKPNHNIAHSINKNIAKYATHDMPKIAFDLKLREHTTEK